MILTDNFLNHPGVYVIRNSINGKYYVGESKNIRRRMGDHRCAKNKQVIHKAISKYGIDNFEVSVLYLPCSDKSNLVSMEESMIKLYNSLAPYGYNVLVKGQELPKNGKPHSKESKAKISNSKKGVKRGPRSRDWTDKIIRSSLKPILQINKETEEIIKEFHSVAEASRELKLDSGDLSRCCNKSPRPTGRYSPKTVGGFKWEFKVNKL